MTKRKPRKQPLRKRFHSREMTNHLLRLAAEAYDVTEADGAISRGQALAMLLWDKALGHIKETVSDEGKRTSVTHAPENWAIQLIYDRMEGKAPQAVPDDAARVTATDKVRELAKNRLNTLVTEAPVVTLPPIPIREESSHGK